MNWVQRCHSNRWSVSSGIRINATVQGFPAEFHIGARQRHFHVVWDRTALFSFLRSQIQNEFSLETGFKNRLSDSIVWL